MTNRKTDIAPGTVKHFTEEESPPNPYTGQHAAGWYWVEADGHWSAEPAPNGRKEAEWHARRAASGTGAVR